MIGLLDDLIGALASKHLPHYFIPAVNLFEHTPSDFLQTAADKLCKLRRDPVPPDESEIGYLSEEEILLGSGMGKPTERHPKHRQLVAGDRDGYTADKLELEMAYLKAECNYTESDISKLKQLLRKDQEEFLLSGNQRDLISKSSIFPEKGD